MVVFRLGHPYPLHNQANGQEKARADLSSAFFSICYYVLGAKPADLALWRGPLEYGLYEAAPGVPFILTRLGRGWLSDVTLNLRMMARADERTAWPELPAEEPAPFSLALIDAQTNQLLGYRYFNPSPAFVQLVREAARRQLTHFADHLAVEQAIAREETMPLQLMAQQARWFKAPD